MSVPLPLVWWELCMYTHVHARVLSAGSPVVHQKGREVILGHSDAVRDGRGSL